MEKIKVELAQLKDLIIVKILLTDTARWLNSKGSTQWAGLLKGEDVHNIEDAISRQEVFLAYRFNKIVGIFTLWSEQSIWDKDLWGEDNSKEFFYLHRLALATTEHGKGTGRILIDKAKNIALLENKKGLRLDCVASNSYLNKFYKNNNFSFQKVVENYYNGEDYQDYHLFSWENEN